MKSKLDKFEIELFQLNILNLLRTLSLTVLFAVLVSGEINCINAEAPEEQWIRIYQGINITNVESVQKTLDNGYIIIGTTRSDTKSETDISVIKTGVDGTRQWVRTFGLSGVYEKIESVIQTPDSGYIIAASTASCNGCYIKDIWLVKIDSMGIEKWNKTIAGTDKLRFESISSTSDNGFIISGKNVINSTTLLLKTDSKGIVQWNNTLEGIDNFSPDIIQQTFDGGYIIGGTTSIGHLSVMIVKTDHQGNKEWIKTFGGSNYDWFSYLWQTTDGGYIVASRTLNFDANFWAIKIDHEGIIQWAKDFDGVRNIWQTYDGGCILADKNVIKIDQNADLQWDLTFENCWIGSILQISDHGYILAGERDSDIWLIKLEDSGPIPCALFKYYPAYPGMDQSITFDASASFDPDGNITHYIWDFGDGSIITTTEKIITHSYDLTGKYHINLIVIDNDQIENSTCKDLTVQQNPQPQKIWNKTFDGDYEKLFYLQQTSDGGYILAGEAHLLFSSKWGICLIKTDPYGNMQWNKTFQGPQPYGGCYVDQTGDDGYIIAAFTRSIGPYDSGIELIRTDTTGNEQWRRNIITIHNVEVCFVQQTAEGGYIIATARGGNSDANEFWMLKTDYRGNELWSRNCSGIYFGIVKSLKQTSDGGYIIAGDRKPKSADTTATSWIAKTDFWLLKIDSDGNELWNQTYDIYGSKYSNKVRCVDQTHDGGYIIVGSSSSTRSNNRGKYEILLVKTTSSGDMQWHTSFTKDGYDRANAVKQTFDGGYIIASETKRHSTDVWLLKTDSNGNMQWEETFEGIGDVKPKSVLVISDGSFIIAGEKESISLNNIDFWMIKLGGVRVGPDKQQKVSEKQPVQIPDTPGFGAVFACISLLLVVMRILKKE